MNTPGRPEPVFLGGPTASGKSAVALALAEELGGEIISVDSMQVYRGMDIGTGKPDLADRRRVPHHLIDILDLRQSFDVAQFVERARDAAAEVQGRGRVPIFCGGTGLYFKAYLEGIGSAPPADPQLREELSALSLPELLRQLLEKDPVLYERIDRDNARRVIRAVEVMRLTGRPFSAMRDPWNPVNAAGKGMFVGLQWPAEELRKRIERRVEVMFESGFVEEVRRLADELKENLTAQQALGYRQILEHLRGERDLESTVALVKQKTRQYARRQSTWFRRQSAMDWVPVQEPFDPACTAKGLATRWRGSE